MLYSQSSLQDFTDCPRRFELRYLLQIAWPAPQSAPQQAVEEHLLLGERFHLLIQQHQNGLALENLAANLQPEILAEWWQNYLHYVPPLLRDAAQIWSEISLSAALNQSRLIAKYDLLVRTHDNKFRIFDWKTSHRPPSRAALQERLQTQLYPYLLCRAGADFNNGQPIAPEQIEMIYWFSQRPARPERIPYNHTQYQAAEDRLKTLLNHLNGLQPGQYPLTTNEKHCAYCIYRSLCARGVHAGDLQNVEDDLPEIAFDFDTIPEIEL